MNEQKPLFSFGVVADVQYGDKPDDTKNKRWFKLALEKLDEARKTFNDEDLAFTVHLGDIMDGNSSFDQTKKDLDLVIKTFNKIKSPVYHVLGIFNSCDSHTSGNHCLQLPRDVIASSLSLPSPNYNFFVVVTTSGVTCTTELPSNSNDAHVVYKFIVLDGTDISVYGWPKESENYRQAKEYLDTHSLEQHCNATTWNSGIGESQINWFNNELEQAKRNKHNVIVFNHYPICGEAAITSHTLWNADVILNIIDKYRDVVVAYMNGHYHVGGYAFRNSVHHFTMKGMVEAPIDSNHYGIMDVFADKIMLRGYGHVANQRFEIKDRLVMYK